MFNHQKYPGIGLEVTPAPSLLSVPDKAFPGLLFMEKPKLIQDLGILQSGKRGRHYGLFECPFCNKSFKAQIQSINSGNTRSCGCYDIYLSTERLISFNTTHGLSKSPLYHVWGLMKKRCYDKNDIGYNNYGGRGITICDEWRNDFVSFYHWGMSHGYQKGLDIDREKNNLGYYPNNCRFVTDTVNAQNTRLIKANNTSGYRGVGWHKATQMWYACITFNRKKYWLGLFSTSQQAAQAYNNFVIENKTAHPLNILPFKNPQ